MQRKYIFLGGVMVFILSIFIIPQPSLAAENTVSPCNTADACLVPAPTVLNIQSGDSIYSGQVIIAGVSWNKTKVDVYIDGQYNGRAVLRTDESGVGDFYYRPFLRLTPGKHTVYTVARNLNERERSVESTHIEFIVKAVPIIDNMAADEQQADIQPADEQHQAQPDEEPQDERLPLDTQQSDDQVNVTQEGSYEDITVAPQEEGQVNIVEDGQIRGGVSSQQEPISDLQKTADRQTIMNEFFANEVTDQEIEFRQQRNRTIGLAMLTIIIIIIAVWAIISRNEERRQEIEDMFTQSKDDLYDQDLSTPEDNTTSDDNDYNQRLDL